MRKNPEMWKSIDNPKRHYIRLLSFITRLKSEYHPIYKIGWMCFTNSLNLCRLFNEIKTVYSGIIFAQLVCGTWFIAASLFQMDMVTKWIHDFEILFDLPYCFNHWDDSIFRRPVILTFTFHHTSIRLRWALPICICIAIRLHQLLRTAINIPI